MTKRHSWIADTWVVAEAGCDCGWTEPFNRLGEAHEAARLHAAEHRAKAKDLQEAGP